MTAVVASAARDLPPLRPLRPDQCDVCGARETDPYFLPLDVVVFDNGLTAPACWRCWSKWPAGQRRPPWPDDGVVLVVENGLARIVSLETSELAQ
jgi:hypothetical protein